MAVAHDRQVWVLDGRLEAAAISLASFAIVQVLLTGLELVQELEDIDLVLAKQLWQVLNQNALIYSIVLLIQQVVHQKDQRPIQVVVQAFLDESLKIPIRHETHLRLNLQTVKELLQYLSALFLLHICRVVQHLEQCTILDDLRVVPIDLVQCIGQILDRVLESRIVKGAKAAPLKQVTELKVAFDLFLEFALEYLL